MLLARRRIRLETDRLTLRAPVHSDFRDWSTLRAQSQDFLTRWEPTWAGDHLTRKSFTNRVYWAQRAVSNGTAQAGTLGYWIGAPHARQGYMREAILALVHHAFQKMDLSRIEAACLPENAASRGLLERSGFKYEGVAQSYLQINGRWRTHVLYSCLRLDRRGKTDAGL